MNRDSRRATTRSGRPGQPGVEFGAILGLAGRTAQLGGQPSHPPASRTCQEDRNAPVTQTRTASGMAVVIDGCTATIDLHGYVHSDYPLVTYMRMMSLDMSLHRGTGPADAQVEITVHTPKDDIRLRGNLDGQVDMDTCQ